jgi:hypothetical protein
MTTNPASSGWAPDACTLPAAERPLRGAEFSALFATSLVSMQRIDGTRLRMTLVGGADLLPTVADLTARETQCCSFFRFVVSAAGDGVELEVSVPASYVDVLDGLQRQARAAAGLST